MSETDSAAKPPREFQLIKNPSEAQKLLKEGAKTLASTIVWTRDQKHLIHTHLTLYSEADPALHIWVPKELDVHKLMDDMAKLSLSDCFFSVSLARANIFFKCAFIGYENNGLRFRLPEQVFKVQRRRDMRHSIPDGYVLRIHFKDPLYPDKQMSKKALDLSASGMGILVDPDEAPLFPAGLVLEELTFTLHQRKIVCQAVIRHTRELPRDSRFTGMKVGVSFKGLKAADTQFIASYVFEESRKFYSRYMS